MSEVKVDEILQKGIRAARRGYKEPAQRLLGQVLQADPNNEEAWLWLSRVVETPEQRANCLQRVLAVNPDNRWAAEQLAALQAEAPLPAVPAEELHPPLAAEPSPTLKLEQVQCPQCGGSVELRGGSDVQTLACGYCQSVIDLTAEQAAVVGSAGKRARSSVPIELGAEATFDGQRYQVIGWIRYEGWDDEDRWRWDEWLLASSEGEYRWLSYDKEEGFILQKKVPLTAPFDPRRATFIEVPGGKALVTERSPARILALAGELTWQARVGEQLNYLEARQGEMRYSVEYTKDEIEVLAGSALSASEVWQAFGRQDLLERVQQQEKAKRQYYSMAVVAAIFMLLGCLGTLFATVSGRQLLAQELKLTKASPLQVVGPFEVAQPGRAHRVSLRTSLPTNTWAVVDVSAFDDRENEYYLFAKEFWDEAGRDSEGSWHESDLKISKLFRPDEAGQYILELSMDEASVDSLPLEVEVKGAVWVGSYFVVFAVLCLGLGVVFVSLGSRRVHY